ncbi:histidine kinase [Actinoplanes sp. NPDC049596]|uniref:sensor histidine kinase n=1 Tax=unclassified Actinoplanes TaxID=2626549 RepID=UPI0034247415
MQTEEPALTRLLVVRWMQLLTPLMLAWFVWAAAAAEPGFGSPIVVVATAVFVLAVFGRNATAVPPVRPAHVVSVAAMLVSSVTLVTVQPGGPGSVAVLVAVLCAATGLMPVRLAVPVLIAAFVVLEMVASITGQDFGFLAVIAVSAVLFGSMYLAFRLAEAQRETKRLLAEVEAGQAARAEAAGLAERQRLAREMHDVLAHSLSGLTLQLEGARMLLAEDPADPRLPLTVDRAHHLARTGLEEARRAIGMLRDADLPGPDRLPALTEQFARDQAVPCDFAVSGDPHPLGSEARLAVYRVAQEALTNVIKHAAPARVSVRLAYEPVATRLTVEDFTDGPPTEPSGPLAEPGGPSTQPGGPSTQPGGPGTQPGGPGTQPGGPGTELGGPGGYGLTGMRERAELLGGTLHAGTTGHGFRVELAVPA